MHRIFGYLTVAVLALHTTGALLILYEDVEGHTLLNKALLLSSLASTVYNVAGSIKEAVNKNFTAHRIMMVQAFISSLDGAGTIRTVAQIQMMLGYGPIWCQCEYGSVRGNCDWTYTWRLMWIIVLRLLQQAVYAKSEHPRLVTRLWDSIKTFYIPFWALLVVSFMMGFRQEQALLMVLLFNIVRYMDFSKMANFLLDLLDLLKLLALDLSDAIVYEFPTVKTSSADCSSHQHDDTNGLMLCQTYKSLKRKLRNRLSGQI